MMLDGGNAVLFMKQLDFLLLGLDQLVNTFNSYSQLRHCLALAASPSFRLLATKVTRARSPA